MNVEEFPIPYAIWISINNHRWPPLWPPKTAPCNIYLHVDLNISAVLYNKGYFCTVGADVFRPTISRKHLVMRVCLNLILTNSSSYLVCIKRFIEPWIKLNDRKKLDSKFSCYIICHNAVQCRYNPVNFPQNRHKRHPSARQWGRVKGCLLLV